MTDVGPAETGGGEEKTLGQTLWSVAKQTYLISIPASMIPSSEVAAMAITVPAISAALNPVREPIEEVVDKYVKLLLIQPFAKFLTANNATFTAAAFGVATLFNTYLGDDKPYNNDLCTGIECIEIGAFDTYANQALPLWNFFAGESTVVEVELTEPAEGAEAAEADAEAETVLEESHSVSYYFGRPGAWTVNIVETITGLDMTADTEKLARDIDAWEGRLGATIYTVFHPNENLDL